VAVTLRATFALLPLLLVWLVSGPPDASYAAKVEVAERLGATQQGKLQFLLVAVAAGQAPAGRFVITLDRDYTRGLPAEVRPGDVFWAAGTLMDRATYYGEQYLFFGYPQIYVDQVRSGPFWPSQSSALAALYAAPVYSVVSLYLVAAMLLALPGLSA
jgi:hypothetical protein